MNVIRIDESAAAALAPLVAGFRAALRAYKGIASTPDLEAGREEILWFLNLGYPVFAVEDGGDFVGYAVCRIEDDVLWLEQIFVRGDCRRRGVASLLFGEAEALARSMGEDTIYNYVHPNNHGMIAFLRSKGYNVLNLIEIRKPYAGEKLTTTITVGDNTFDY